MTYNYDTESLPSVPAALTTPMGSPQKILELPSVAESVVPDLVVGADTFIATVLLPAYNEEAGLRAVLPRLLEVSNGTFEILVVDDGSSDATAAVAESMGCRVVRHAVNAGKGAAVRTGLKEARGAKIVVMDADDTYPADAVLTLFTHLDHCDIVMGVRTVGREHIPLLNRFGNAVFTTAIRLVSRCHWRDPLTGLYGLRRTALERMELTSKGFSLEAEIAIKSGRLGLRKVDHPIEYRPRAGATKLRPVRDGMVIALMIASLGLRLAPSDRTSRRAAIN